MVGSEQADLSLQLECLELQDREWTQEQPVVMMGWETPKYGMDSLLSAPAEPSRVLPAAFQFHHCHRECGLVNQ